MNLLKGKRIETGYVLIGALLFSCLYMAPKNCLDRQICYHSHSHVDTSKKKKKILTTTKEQSIFSNKSALYHNYLLCSSRFIFIIQ